MWSEETKPENEHRYLKKTWTDKMFFEKYKGENLRGIVEEIHPSKCTVYFYQLGFLSTIVYSEVQVVVLSEKTESILIIMQMDNQKTMLEQ